MLWTCSSGSRRSCWSRGSGGPEPEAMFIYIYISLSLSTYIYIYIIKCVYIYIYLYIYIYIYMFREREGERDTHIHHHISDIGLCWGRPALQGSEAGDHRSEGRPGVYSIVRSIFKLRISKSGVWVKQSLT